MANFIIVEGPDGAGKDTLINDLLIAYRSATVVHFSKPEPDVDQFSLYAEPIINAKPDETIILNRSWYSEFVYGLVMRNGQFALNKVQAKALEQLIIANGGGHIIYVTARPKVLWARCMKRGETYIKNIEQIDMIARAYEDIMDEANLPVVKMYTDR